MPLKNYGGKGKLTCGKNDKSGGAVATNYSSSKSAKDAADKARDAAEGRADRERKRQERKKCPKGKDSCKIKTEDANDTKNPRILGNAIKQGKRWYVDAECEWTYRATCSKPKKENKNKGKKTGNSKKQKAAKRKKRRR